MKPYLFLLPLAALAQWMASAQTTTIPITGLCNTGLTTASPQPTGCAGSTLVTPVNPQTGGSSIDGNWQLATPYPSSQYYYLQAPDPCSLPKFGSAWVDTPGSSDWLNPDDGLSQWISPLNDVKSNGGWYIYRTVFPIPPGSGPYVLVVEGQVLADDYTTAIFLENPAGYAPGCQPASIPAPLPLLWTTWYPFGIETTVMPGTYAYLYFLVYNQGYEGPDATGLRVEFKTAYVTPI